MCFWFLFVCFLSIYGRYLDCSKNWRQIIKPSLLPKAGAIKRNERLIMGLAGRGLCPQPGPCAALLVLSECKLSCSLGLEERTGLVAAAGTVCGSTVWCWWGDLSPCCICTCWILPYVFGMAFPLLHLHILTTLSKHLALLEPLQPLL